MSKAYYDKGDIVLSCIIGTKFKIVDTGYSNERWYHMKYVCPLKGDNPDFISIRTEAELLHAYVKVQP